jgi:hypothetical protein
VRWSEVKWLSRHQPDKSISKYRESRYTWKRLLDQHWDTRKSDFPANDFWKSWINVKWNNSMFKGRQNSNFGFERRWYSRRWSS